MTENWEISMANYLEFFLQINEEFEIFLLITKYFLWKIGKIFP